jgi:NAD(P)-dependent dehydrogenase (short-subunit alcohol dehydrogenase family)
MAKACGIMLAVSYIKMEGEICDILALNFTQVVAKGMVERGGGGSIVNVSSVASTRALDDHIAYCSSKAAVDSLTKVMALELGKHKVRNPSR